jgi:outer membrane protein OmpA-like peptidoglycan-associated protein
MKNARMVFFFVSLWVFLVPTITAAEEKRDKPARVQAQRLVDKGLALNDNSDAEADFYRRAIDIDPTYASAHFNLGFLYHSRGEPEKAIDAYRQCLRYAPRRHEAHRNLAVCLLTVRRDAALYEVRHHMNRAIELQADLPAGKRPATLNKQRAELLDLELRIHKLLRPVLREHYTSEMMTRILSRRVTRGGQRVYEGPRLPMLFFDTASAVPAKQKEKQLDALAVALKDPRLASHDFTIEGHADGRGRGAMNLGLSRRRAGAIRNRLMCRGSIKPERLKVASYGEDHPIFPNDSAKNFHYNRRIEIVRRYAR